MVEGTENVFMLCWYEAGYEGMESDSFGLCCKFFADDEIDAEKQFEECRRKYPEIAEGLFVQPYNDYYDQYDEDDPYDESYNVYQDLDTWFQKAKNNADEYESYMGDEKPPFMSAETIESEDLFDLCRDDDVYSSECINCDIDDYTFINNKDGYNIYRKVVEDENGIHGEWVAQLDDESSEPFSITYLQAIGQEDITPNLGKEIGKKILPNQTIEGTWVYDDDDFFIKEEVDEFANGVADALNAKDALNGGDGRRFGVSDVYTIGRDEICISIVDTENLDEYESSVIVDFRRIRKPSDIKKYEKAFVDDFSDYFGLSDIYSTEEIDVEDISEYDLPQVDQQYTSKNTSQGNRRPGSVPKLFRLVAEKFGWPAGAVILDYGCGGDGNKENAANFLDQFDVEYVGYDKYMQSPEANRAAIKRVRDNGGADIVTCSNVLNTIKEPETRLNILENIKREAKPGADIYITAWRNPKGVEGPTGNDQYQLHWRPKDYLDEIHQVFPDAYTKGELIVATNGGEAIDSATHIPPSDIELVMQEAANVQTEEDLNAVMGSLLSIDKDLYNKYMDMINSGEYSFAAIGKEISDDLYYMHQDVTSATNTCNIAAGYDGPERDINPPEYDDPTYAEDVEETIEVDLSGAQVNVDENGIIKFTNYDWMKNVDNSSYTYPIVYLDDEDDIQYNVEDVLQTVVPADAGTYKLDGWVNLVYDIKNVEINQYDEDDIEYMTENAEIEFNFRKSSAANVTVKKI